MAITDLKCIYCGKQYEGDTANAETTCPDCGKTFSTTRASKYFKSVKNLMNEEKKAAYGEMHAYVDELITEGEFYVNNEEYDVAIEKFLKALEITTVERRVYLGLVKAYTKNFTDYSDNLHYEYLNKAITYSTKQQKDEIREMYKTYYQKRNLTAEEMVVINEEELKERKSRVEELLKDGIPRHYNALKQTKTLKIIFPVILAIAVITIILSLVIKNAIAELILTAAATLLVIALFILIVIASGSSSKTKIYDCVLDLYDEYEKFNLTVGLQIELFTLIEKFAVLYLNNATPVTLENSLADVAIFLKEKNNDKIDSFINKYKILLKLIKEIENDEIPQPEILNDDE